MDKKGFTFRMMVLLVVVLVSLIVITLFYKNYADSLNPSVDRSMCKNSVRTSAMSKLVVADGIMNSMGESVEIKCPTIYKDVEEGKEVETLAYEMAACYDTFLEGDVEIFDTKDNNYCVVCSVLDMKSKKPIRGLTEYLMTHNVPFKNELYINYLAGKSYKGQEVVKPAEQYDVIDGTKRQAVVFFMGKDAFPDGVVESDKSSTTIIGGSAGFVGGVAATIFALGAGSCATGVGCVWGGVMMVAAGAVGGGSLGYLVGSSEDAYWDSGVMVVDYDAFLQDGRLNCTYLEGKAGQLEPMD